MRQTFKNFFTHIMPKSSSKEESSQLKIEFFKDFQPIGTGHFSKVIQAKLAQNNQIYALKLIDKKSLKKNNLTQNVMNEIGIQVQLDHPNIIKFFDHFEDKKTIYLQLEYANSGSLYKLITRKSEKRLSEVEGLKIIRQIISAISYLHSKEIIHRDITSENILLTRQSEDLDFQIKLSDFSLSNFQCQDKKKRKTFGGTAEYLAPEMILEKGHNVKLDIWNLGIVIYEIFTGKTPFHVSKHEKGNLDSLQKKILQQQIQFPKNFPVGAKDLVLKMLERDQSKRYTIDQVKNHPWLKKFSQDNEKFIEMKSLPLHPIKTQSEQQFMMMTQPSLNNISKSEQLIDHQQDQINITDEVYEDYQLDPCQGQKEDFPQFRVQQTKEILFDSSEFQQSPELKIQASKGSVIIKIEQYKRNRQYSRDVLKLWVNKKKQSSEELTKFKIKLEEVQNQFKILKEQNKDIIFKLEQESRIGRKSLLTYQNYDSYARQNYVQWILEEMIPKEQNIKFCLKQKINEQVLVLGQIKQCQDQIDKLVTESKKNRADKKSLIEAIETLRKQSYEIIERRNHMILQIGLIKTQQKMDEQFSSNESKTPEIVGYDVYQSFLEELNNYEFQIQMTNSQKSESQSSQEILKSLSLENENQILTNSEKEEIQQKFGRFEDQFKKQMEDIQQKKKQVSQEIEESKALIVKLNEKVEEKKIKSKFEEVDRIRKKIKKLEEQAYELIMDVRSQTDRIKFVEEQILYYTKKH